MKNNDLKRYTVGLIPPFKNKDNDDKNIQEDNKANITVQQYVNHISLPQSVDFLNERNLETLIEVPLTEYVVPANIELASNSQLSKNEGEEGNSSEEGKISATNNQYQLDDFRPSDDLCYL